MATKRISRRAVLLQDVDGFQHVTAVSRLPSIRERGLLVKPPVRTYGKKTGHDETIGGIYLTPPRNFENVMDILCADLASARLEVGVLTVSLPKGTRFCLDEDEIAKIVGLSLSERREFAECFLGGLQLLTKVTLDCWSRGFYRDCARKKLDKWSCLLAQALDQKHIGRFNIRVFDPPVITSVRIESCATGSPEERAKRAVGT